VLWVTYLFILSVKHNRYVLITWKTYLQREDNTIEEYNRWTHPQEPYTVKKVSVQEPKTSHQWKNSEVKSESVNRTHRKTQNNPDEQKLEYNKKDSHDNIYLILIILANSYEFYSHFNIRDIVKLMNCKNQWDPIS
jgi:hypothetical protein